MMGISIKYCCVQLEGKQRHSVNIICFCCNYVDAGVLIIKGCLHAHCIFCMNLNGLEGWGDC
jgi:hypothetical protein